jgi:hypothetical protein
MAPPQAIVAAGIAGVRTGGTTRARNYAPAYAVEGDGRLARVYTFYAPVTGQDGAKPKVSTRLETAC